MCNNTVGAWMRGLGWIIGCVASAAAIMMFRRVDVAALVAGNGGGGGTAGPSASPTVLVLTPLDHAAEFVPAYEKLLMSLDYPRGRLSLALLAPERQDDPETLRAVEAAAARLRTAFRRVKVLEKTFRPRLRAADRRNRHDVAFQYPRRQALARARNYLLSRALTDEDWVLWVDADLQEWPRDILQQLLSANRSVVTPNVVQSAGGRSYDLNSWQRKPDLARPPFAIAVATEPVRAFAAAAAARCDHLAAPAQMPSSPIPLPGATGPLSRRIVEAIVFNGPGAAWTQLLGARGAPDALVGCLRAAADDLSFRRDVRDHIAGPGAEMHLEGYASPSVTLPLHKLRGRGRVVELGGVGGAVLLVRGDLHRAGLVFPPFLLHNRIETEGLAVMARLMGERVWGMPGLEVIHTRH